MSIHPDYISIGDVFSRNYIFRVPRYQRGYAWEEAEVADFLRDLQGCYDARSNGQQRNHFFGGIVAVNREVTGSAGRHCDLIDGQQRLATFVLLASCLEKHFLALSAAARDAGDADTEELAQTRAEQIRRMYLEFHDEINREPVVVDRLELSKPDRAFFGGLIHDQHPTPEQDRQSHARLQSAHATIFSHLQALLTADASANLDALAIFRDVLLHDASVINIITAEQSEAYRIFQVLNDRGTKLSEGDLLRASTLEMLGTLDLCREHDAAAEAWDDVLRDSPTDTQKYLRWYFASILGRRPGQSSLFDEFFDAFFPQHKHPRLSRSAAGQVLRTVRQIRDEIARCRLLVEGTWPFSQGHASRWERDRLYLLVQVLDHTNCLPLLLAACQLDESKFSQIVQNTERFAFRYKLICNLHIGSLTDVYHEQSVHIRHDPRKYQVLRLQTEYRRLQDGKATDPLFATGLKERLSYQPSTGNKVIKYFLTTIDDYLRWYNAGAKNRPMCRDTTRVLDLTATTIEHIYPSKPAARGRNTHLDPLVNTIGNLTVLGPSDNETVANAAFTTKQKVLAESTLMINREIATATKWTKQAVLKRQKRLQDVALKVFRI